jgi:hypothetical protein
MSMNIAPGADGGGFDLCDRVVSFVTTVMTRFSPGDRHLRRFTKIAP